ncbi:hypothetical protein LBMAG37_13850 [Anaerolineae bacterium]|nr:30S ribosomal protein S18 1 [Anaerolineaceae bacterium]GBL38620.1 30S ribosomal protein S18 1 [Anaerolineaceae bacterium]GDX68230.1 hypothetical protein LBMAG37_13850 [Anaerolineae bacterium]
MAYRESNRSEGRGGRDDRRRPPRFCYFCSNKVNQLDYKDVDVIVRSLNESGSIQPMRRTGTCALHQRMLVEAVKRARHMALLPFVGRVARPRTEQPEGRWESRGRERNTEAPREAYPEE